MVKVNLKRVGVTSREAIMHFGLIIKLLSLNNVHFFDFDPSKKPDEKKLSLRQNFLEIQKNIHKAFDK